MRILASVIGFLLLSGVVSAQYNGAFHTGFPTEPVRGYFQPVAFRTPEGTNLACVAAGQFSERLPSPLQMGLLIGCDYRLRVTNIPFHPGKELFPTVTLLARTYPPQGREADFPIAINITLEDLELALAGRYITRVVYLENPKSALPIQSTDDEQVSHDINGGDPLAVAATQGLPVAIVRIGGRVPSQNTPNGLLNADFCFGSPPWVLNRTVAPETIVPPIKNPIAQNSLTVDPNLKSSGQSVLEQQQELRPNAWQPPHRPNVPGGRADEYLVSGNNAGRPAFVENNSWTVHNFNAGDTVAHFDTLDGRTLVEPSNRIHIYAPRFGSIRKIEGLLLEGQVTGLVAAHNRQVLDKNKDAIQATFTEQETATRYARTRDQINSIEGQRRIAGMDSPMGLGAYDNFLVVDSDSMVLLQKTFDFGGSTKTQIERGKVKADEWIGAEGIRVQINELAPMAATGIEGAAVYFQVKDEALTELERKFYNAAAALQFARTHHNQSHPALSEAEREFNVVAAALQQAQDRANQSQTKKLRLIKVASKESAQPGEIVEFTLRFDNVGNDLIGNVTIMDDLTNRLEFLPGTAVASLASGFAVQPNMSGSFTLRFEITEPLAPGDFGVVRFQCRVR